VSVRSQISKFVKSNRPSLPSLPPCLPSEYSSPPRVGNDNQRPPCHPAIRPPFPSSLLPPYPQSTRHAHVSQAAVEVHRVVQQGIEATHTDKGGGKATERRREGGKEG